MCSCVFTKPSFAQEQVGLWMKFDKSFTSQKVYDNPLYDVEKMEVHLTSPSGRKKQVNGFWDGGALWRFRFAPDELGTWTYTTVCSDESNKGLHRVNGSFTSVPHQSKLAIYTKGSITRPKGSYHLAHADGTPFFYVAGTAWNGPLKSTDEEWCTYLEHRARNYYSVIQFATTQWRGADANRLGQVAFEGSGKIRINPAFFQHLDKKIDEINRYGLVAAPVLLWALPFADGRELNPGYYLPDPDAILLARYLVARYGGNQVIWILGGDGQYEYHYEQRWKNIGRGVFGELQHPGVVSLHPYGSSWIGDEYANEEWLDIVGYQSGHNNDEKTVTWITEGPVVKGWQQLPPKAIINMEPCYEEIFFKIADRDVRNASYWSLFATPVAGIAYGANGIWSWLRPGETILNHEDATGTHPWYESINFQGSMQVGYLSAFFQQLEWWRLRPANELLAMQPGIEEPHQFVSLLKAPDYSTILAYIPEKSTARIFNRAGYTYEGKWFNPVSNRYTKASLLVKQGIIEAKPPTGNDMILVLKKSKRQE
ncbi:DUF4038 domain-containing protein [Pontibacter sp. M82]|uniref:DUF4038 domain-containing protein n=2 Tax=Pontibacter anaerobius TaxID=2993940 RepID=A0ABT3RDI6_9BACT|nr:DUF4038 domain-containing protein [Pontibacter anaerobius]MCX2739509.1 DUF4038 domain-containing protein [Pontibacter anaerobius]